MKTLQARAVQLGGAMQRRRITQLTDELRERGFSAVAEQEAVVVSGKRLTRRWLAEPMLRFLGRLSQ